MANHRIHIVALIATLLCIGNTNSFAQSFLDSMGPTQKTSSSTKKSKTQQKKEANLPDKPNVTDSLGRKQGQWAKKYPNGRYSYEATFKDDRPVGKIRRYYDDGKLSMTISYDTNDTCRVVSYYPNKKVEYRGQYFNKLREGTWYFYSAEGYPLSRETYSHGVLHGIRQILFEDGHVYEATTWVDGLREGPYIRYFISGTKQVESAYHKDELHGRFREWGSDGGLILDGTYDNGTRVGTWKVRYLDAGNLKSTIIYDNHGIVQNRAEADSIESLRIKYYEDQKGRFDDPELYINDPESYVPFKRQF